MITRSMSRFAPSPIIVLLLAASLLANVALAIVALDLTDDLPALGAQAAPTAMPKAYDVEGAGEGLVGHGVPVTATPAVKAYWQPYMGEDRTNITSPHSLRPVIAYAPLGQGEGWVGGGLKNEHAIAARQLQAHANCGQGEGLVQHAIAVENPCK
jgi:hypothetical protein